MKTVQILIFSLLFAVATTQIGCVTDPCAKISCQNGGNCESGTCKCPSGYSGTNCEKGEVCRISKYDEQSDAAPVVAHTLTYDALGRLVANASSTSTVTFSYTTGQVEQTTTYSSSSDYIKQKFILNAKGYPITEYDEFSNAGGISRDTVQYGYDANNYFTSITGSSFSIVSTYVNGNRTTRIYTDNGATYYTANYEYYTNTLPNSYGGFGLIFGTPEKNMRKKITRNYTSGTKRTFDYTYEYDVKGNVTKERITTTDYDASNTVTSTAIRTSNYTIACVQP